MKRYLICLAYNGKNFCGWQIQENAVSVQATVKTAIETVLRQNIELQGAGRTDTDVNASFYVAHFDVEKVINNIPQLINSLNGVLRKDIVIFDVFEVENSFNSRYNAISRTYKYFVSTEKTPFCNELSFYFKYQLDIEKMNNACDLLKKYEDFRAFQKVGSDVKTTICKIYEAYWQRQYNTLVFTIKANRFLRNMVRSIVGTMIDIGQNKINLHDFEEIILSGDRSQAGVSVPGNALFLCDIEYNEPINSRLEISRQKAKLWFYL